MDLQPLYDLRARLEQTAVAGTGLLSEDFRLQRAAESLKPLAARSPVFRKLRDGLEALLASPREEQGGLLLDLLALADAVACTQGSSHVDGALEPLPPGSGTYLPLPCSQLAPLLTALTSTGGGRMEVIQSAWNDHPELFSDYRVLPALLAGLGDKSPYLAELNKKVLASMGPGVLPLLKEGFDPAGRAAMVRRVEAIDAIAGGAENEFYRKMLPRARRDVRLVLIWAMRHEDSNGPKLLELCRGKEGEVQDMACRALACSNAPEAPACFEALAREDLDSCLKRMVQVTQPAPWASRLTARLFQAELDRWEAGPGPSVSFETQERFRLLLSALCWKHGEEVWAVFQRGAALARRLEQPRADTGRPMSFDLSFGLQQAAKDWKHFRSQLAQVLEGTLMRRPRDPEARALALELYARHGAPWLAAALLAQLYALDSAACCDWGEKQFWRTTPGGRTIGPEAADAFCRVFGNVRWSAARGRYEISPLWNYGEDAPFLTPIAPLDPRWFGMFAAGGAHMRHLLVNLLREQRDRPDILAQMGSCLYHAAAAESRPGVREMYLQVLAGLGWRDRAGQESATV